MAEYTDVLRRLDAYRQRMELSKSAMARILGVYQNNYHQIETGRRMLSMESLKNFERNGGDLYPLFTGRERREGPLEELFSRCQSEEHQREILNLLIANLEYASWLEGKPLGNVSVQLRKAMRLFEGELKEYTIWKRIRMQEFLNQDQMAELLKVETKRYRGIEKGKDPDVGILCALERSLHYSPQLFFDKKQFFLDELNYFWNELSENMQRGVMQILTEAVERAPVRKIS